LTERQGNKIIKILHVIGSANPSSGGPIEGVIQQNAAMRARNFGYSEVVSLDAEHEPFLRDVPVKVFAMGHKSGRGNRSWLFPLRRYGVSAKILPWLREHVHEYDAVIVNGLWNYSTWAASAILPNQPVPYFVYCHGMLDPWFSRKYPLKHIFKQLSWALCELPLLKKARAVLFTAEEERVLSHGNFWGHSYREKVVGYGTKEAPAASPMQHEAFCKTVPALGNRRFLLFLSRIHPKKGCDLLVDAFASVAARFPDIDLVIAGPDQVGIKKQLMAQAESMGVAARIHWPGLLTGDAKWGAFRAAEAFILPSHQENFGIVVAEAMACGTPVLITNKVNIWREVEACGGGLVENDDFAGVQNLMIGYLNKNADEADRMRQAARQGFERNFDITKVCNVLMDLVAAEVGMR
jgi:glycosyltransferase involved in cell wall biosynthesis